MKWLGSCISSCRAAADVSETCSQSARHLADWTRDTSQSARRTASWPHRWPAGLDGGRHTEPRLDLVRRQSEPQRSLGAGDGGQRWSQSWVYSGVRGRDALRVTLTAEAETRESGSWSWWTHTTTDEIMSVSLEIRFLLIYRVQWYLVSRDLFLGWTTLLSQQGQRF